ncbi:RCC1 domain-containing protein [Streptomyces sp. NBC_00057]|uniref:RCC1 domain-containing protein n=1 Tax=Streptomyces sp. NBC_00057 TaxID=2975634 RepID=UPI003247E37A
MCWSSAGTRRNAASPPRTWGRCPGGCGPVRPARVKDVGAGCTFSAALRQDGTVWTWGAGANGRLGTGDNNDRNTPQKVEDLTDVVSISVGCYHVLALTADGAVKSWGWNGNGQLGNDSLTDSNVPVDVQQLEGVAKLSANSYNSFAILEADNVIELALP